MSTSSARRFSVAAPTRGMAVHGPHVYMGTLDARLIALDRMTGEVGVGRRSGGPVLWLQPEPRAAYHRQQCGRRCPRVARYGIRGQHYGLRRGDGQTGVALVRDSGPGRRSDLRPGRSQWLVGDLADPYPDGADLHRNVAAEKADSAKNADAWTRGGGGVWMTPAYDKTLNLIYTTVGNPSPDLDGGIRPGDNLYTDCVVAIDATTGKTSGTTRLSRMTYGTSTRSPHRS